MRALAPALALLVLVATLPTAQAATGALGVTPTALVIADAQPDQTYLRRVLIQNQVDEPSSLTLTVAGAIAPWTTVNPATFTLPAHSNRWVDVTIATPADTFGGSREGLLHVVTESKGDPAGSGMGLAWSVLVKLDVTVDGPPRPSLTLDELVTEDVEVGSPPFLRTRITNDGNVQADANLVFEVWSQDGATLLMTLNRNVPLQPGEEIDLPVSFEGSLPEGSYQLRIRGSGAADFEQAREFNVVGVGQLGKKGELRFLHHDPRATVGDLVRVVAVFDNVGQAAIVRPRLIAEVLHAGKVVGVIEAEGLVQAAGQRQNLTGYFTPRAAGEHTLHARIVYDGAETDPVGSLLMVEALPEEGWTLTGLGGAFLGALGGMTGGVLPPQMGLGLLGLTLAVFLAFAVRRRRHPPAPPEPPA